MRSAFGWPKPAAVYNSYETGILFHFDDADDRCHDAEARW